MQHQRACELVCAHINRHRLISLQNIPQLGCDSLMIDEAVRDYNTQNISLAPISLQQPKQSHANIPKAIEF